MSRIKHPLRFTLGVVMLVFLVVAFTSFASANTIPPTGMGIFSTPVDLDDVLPADCLGFQLDNVIQGNGIIVGTNDSDLIYGGIGGDTISGLNQKDCILGGGGNDLVSGGNAEDVLVGGDGNDILDGGNGADVCYGGPGRTSSSIAKQQSSNGGSNRPTRRRSAGRGPGGRERSSYARSET